MSELTFYGLVADLKKLRSAQEQAQADLKKFLQAHSGFSGDARFDEIDEHSILLLAKYDEIIREYEEKNAQAEKGEQYNREMDARNRSAAENREKPWLRLHDGE